MPDLFPSPLQELGGFTELMKCLKEGKTPVQLTGCVETQRVHLLYEAGKAYKWRLIVAGNDLSAKALLEDYRQFEPDALYYPAKDLIFYQADMQGKLLTGQRICVLKRLQENAGGTIITTMDGLMNVLPPFDAWRQHVVMLAEAETVRLESLREDLQSLGYVHVPQVEEPGQFSVRGGILDVFPFSEENPLRIELWGDEVDSIRYFDADSQRSIARVEEIAVYPAQEFVLEKASLARGLNRIRKEYDKQYHLFKDAEEYEEALHLQEHVGAFIEEMEAGITPGTMQSFLPYFFEDRLSLLDYLPAEDTVLFLNEPVQMQEKGETVELEFSESMKHRLEKGYILPRQAGILFTQKEIFAMLQKRRSVALTGLEGKLSMLKVAKTFAIQAQSMNSYKESVELLLKDLQKWKRGKYRVVLLYGSRTKAKRMAQYLQEYELDAFYREESGGMILPGQILVTYGKLHKGFSYPMLKFIVLTETDLFGQDREKRKRAKSRYKGTRISSLSELSVGDYVVHENYGLGIYRGIERKMVDHISRDYIRIEYGDSSSLFVPATQFEYIQKYGSADKKVEKLNNLYGNEWKKTKAKVKTAVARVAEELVSLYAARQDGTGYAFSPDTIWQKEFEELFPYEETSDQLEAIEAAKRDMESAKIMDRLICGDVGYGKTEIAIRAAFKAVQDGKQVVYLVPTTILAQQHFNTFTERMKDYPVRVDMLSRFCTKKQADQTVADLEKGLVDIVIGTHRVLSKDVRFHDLGLLIIDEEQRFGVTHKEKIKQLKKQVDVLTLTATPIPRTLHMSLIGVRDMSVLEEAPSDRVPIQTYVCEYSQEMVREAICRELARNGQVYYVYNRVSGIAKMAADIAALVPDASVAFAHGQMSERELERIMLDFINGEIDVLVSTTIIETGLDIPNVNTILIHDSDRFGLAQLYQLRGRVGRSNRTAYAFILYQRNKQLKEEAQKRLEAIREFTELGSGIRIALRDLEIRGAGNLLGAEQHGHMEAVGYDLYCKLLNEAVRRLQNDVPEEENFETHIDLPVDAYIPEDYIRNEGVKLDMYKRITTVETEEEYMDIQDELIDRFGEPPVCVRNLLLVAYMKALAHSVGVEEIRANAAEARLYLYPKARIDPQKIGRLLERYRGQLKFATAERYVFTWTEGNRSRLSLENTMETVKKLLNDIKMLLVC